MAGNLRLLALALCGAALLLAAAPAAADMPGDPCGTLNAVARTGGPQNLDQRHLMVCDGSVWQLIQEWDRNTGSSLFQVGHDPGACGASKLGRLRYTSADDLWEYCDGENWTPFGSGGGICDDVTDGLAGYWKLDEASGTAAADSAGSNTGTLSGGPVWKPFEGKVAGALQFDGVDDIVEIPSDLSLEGYSQITLSAWVYPTETGQAGASRIISKSDGGSSDDYGLLRGTDNNLTFRVRNASNVLVSHNVAATNTVPTNNWTHILGVYDGTDMRIYINGVESADTPSSQTGGLRNNTRPLTLGSHADSPTNRRFAGLIDDVRVYNRALTPTEIQIVYAYGAAGGDCGAGESLWSQNGSDIYYDAGNVGIGTATPGSDARLTVQKPWNEAAGIWQAGISVEASSSGSDDYRGVVGIETSVLAAATGSTWHEGFGFSTSVKGANDALRQYIYGYYGLLETHQDDEGYGVYITDNVSGASDSTGGRMYGLFIDLNTSAVTRYGIYQVSNNNNRLNGRLGFDTDSPGYRLELPNSTSDGVGRARANQWATYSDGRFKTNVAPIAGALDKVSRLSGVTYNWKTEAQGPAEMGFIAQDVREIVPEIVSVSPYHYEAEDGTETAIEDYHSVDYGRLTPLLVEAIKELKAEIRGLRNEIELLKAQGAQ